MLKLIILFFATISPQHTPPQFAGISSASQGSPIKQLLRMKLTDQAAAARSDSWASFNKD